MYTGRLAWLSRIHPLRKINLFLHRHCFHGRLATEHHVLIASRLVGFRDQFTAVGQNTPANKYAGKLISFRNIVSQATLLSGDVLGIAGLDKCQHAAGSK